MAAPWGKHGKHGKGKGNDGKTPKGGGKGNSKGGNSRGDEKPQGSVMPCWLHNSKVHKKTKPGSYDENCRFSHTTIAYAECCKMPTPQSAMNEGYISDGS